MAAIYVPVNLPKNSRLRTFDTVGVQAFVGANATTINQIAGCTESVSPEGYLTLRRNVDLETSFFAKYINFVGAFPQRIQHDFCISAETVGADANGASIPYVAGISILNVGNTDGFGGGIGQGNLLFPNAFVSNTFPGPTSAAAPNIQQSISPFIAWFRIIAEERQNPGQYGYTVLYSPNGFDWQLFVTSNQTPAGRIVFGIGRSAALAPVAPFVPSTVSVTLYSYTRTVL